MEHVIDASDLIVGRMSAYAAKWALLGDTVNIVNCEKAILVGRKPVILAAHMHKNELGKVRQGPYFQRMPDRYVRRAIRGMLPHRKFKGREAFKQVMCYIGVPDQFKDKKFEVISVASKNKVTRVPTMTVKELCKLWGGR